MNFTDTHIEAQSEAKSEAQHGAKDQRLRERFSAEVETWLDGNLPKGMGPAACRQPSSGDWPALNQLRLRLGKKGWLAVQEPQQGFETVLAEALEKRGLAWMRDQATEALNIALDAWATPPQIQEFDGPLTRREPVVWITWLELDTDVDVSRIGISATEDGDDYVVDGRGLFQGIGPQPDLLWALVKLGTGSGPENPGLGSICSCLIPTGSPGIVYPRSRTLTPGVPRVVIFNQVRVPRYLMLGPPRDGAMVMQSATAAATHGQDPHAGDAEAAWLQRFLLDTVSNRVDPDQREILQQSVMDSYIDARVSRLFRIRDAWMRAHSEITTYQPAQTRLWESRAAMRLAETARQVLGPYSLLDYLDSRAPAEGRFEQQQRRSLDQNSAGSQWLAGRDSIARHLGLGRQAPGPVPAEAPEPV